LDNLQDKTRRLLSLQKLMQISLIRTNPKIRSNPKKLSFFMKSPSVCNQLISSIKNVKNVHPKKTKASMENNQAKKYMTVGNIKWTPSYS